MTIKLPNGNPWRDESFQPPEMIAVEDGFNGPQLSGRLGLRRFVSGAVERIAPGITLRVTTSGEYELTVRTSLDSTQSYRSSNNDREELVAFARQLLEE